MNIDAFIRSCSSFMEFFEKAKSLKPKDQGDVFERLVQLHLLSKPKYASELSEVWLLQEVPLEVRKHLRLPVSAGGDGVVCVAYKLLDLSIRHI